MHACMHACRTVGNPAGNLPVVRSKVKTGGLLRGQREATASSTALRPEGSCRHVLAAAVNRNTASPMGPLGYTVVEAVGSKVTVCRSSLQSHAARASLLSRRRGASWTHRFSEPLLTAIVNLRSRA